MARELFVGSTIEIELLVSVLDCLEKCVIGFDHTGWYQSCDGFIGGKASKSKVIEDFTAASMMVPQMRLQRFVIAVSFEVCPGPFALLRRFL